MKIVRMKRKKSEVGADMFVVMCLLQSAAVILLVVSLYVMSKASPSSFSQALDTIERIFGEDIDIGGYFTPDESFHIQPMPGGLSAGEKVTLTAEKCLEAHKTVTGVSPEEASEEACTDILYDAVLPVVGQVTSSYGYRYHPIYKEESFHEGEDIAADEGSPIYAVLDGTVAQAGTAELAGNYIKLRHENGLETLYCHCCELYVSEGEGVKKGEVIASVGQTGLATGPHLHFELHENGEAVDPEKLLAGAGSVH